MRLLIVSGIWPPDVGGPAAHAPELGRFLAERGHSVTGATTRLSSVPPEDFGFPVAAARRDLPTPARLAGAAAVVARAARDADVVYATGMPRRAALAAALRRRPLVLKLVTDPAYDRARLRGLFDGTLDGFQSFGGGRRVAALRSTRDLALRRASAVIAPSRYLAGYIETWGFDPARIAVVPNPPPPVVAATPRTRGDGPLFVFAGRIVAVKNLPLAFAALSAVPGARLVVVGAGPDEAAIRAVAPDAVEFVGAQPRSVVLSWLAAADAAVLPSDDENYPHVAVEAHAAGVPVIATRVGGVPEIVTDGVDGLLVERGDVDGFAAAMRAVAFDSSLRSRLAAGAVARAALRASEDDALERIEAILLDAASARLSAAARPARVVAG